MARKKKEYQWMGGGQLVTVETRAGTSVADVVQMIPGVPIADEAGVRTNFLIEAMYLHFHVKRLLITDFDALAFLVYQGNMSDSGNNPVQSLDALSTEDRLYSRKQLMMMGPLPVPPVISSEAVFTTQEEIKVVSFEYQAKRKHDRSQQVLCMTVNADVSLVVQVFCQWRVLVSW